MNPSLAAADARSFIRIAAAVFGLCAAALPAAAAPIPALEAALTRAEALAPLETAIVSWRGEILAERGYRGHSTSAATNIMSASKSVMSALVGIAVDKGLLEGTGQLVAPLLKEDLPARPDPRLARVSIGHLLSMQAGLGSTSGAGYGAWVASPHWVRAALARPFEAEPGGAMVYSTGSTHLLSAILSRAAGRPTLDLAREWLKPLKGFSIAAWERDPQGLHMGGNLMSMSPRSLLAFGELYRLGGVTPEGARLISKAWIDESWRPRTTSRWTGDGYGYGWFARQVAGEETRYAWGYGGQMLFILPEVGLTVVMTSDPSIPSGRTGHREALMDLLAEIVTATAPLEAAHRASR